MNFILTNYLYFILNSYKLESFQKRKNEMQIVNLQNQNLETH